MVATTHRPTPPGRAPGTAGPLEPGRALSPDESAAAVARLFPVVYRRYHSARSLAGGGELPITRSGLEVLIHLASAGPLTIGEQATHLGLRRNSTSELVARLEAKGLVARFRDERDERRVLVWLTDAGREVVSRVGQVLAPDLLAMVMASLDPGDRATVVRGFELLARAEPPDARSVAGSPPPRPPSRVRTKGARS
jgi:DNA-binding MarR family transcriptional regulator